ncbi:aminotransferase class IV [Marinicaulis aureus]|uniref:Probable branched-chain-amino-acid aminotransferase n=1 Tax=Hyphococcus aureus TaxID=2666033 RepID=A0ABW1KV46_9PROT
MAFWLNGDVREDRAAIHIADRGFLLGDGVFETVLMVDGRPAFFSAHIRRMRAGAAALGIEARLDENVLADAVISLAARNEASAGKAWARLTLTRGVGPRGLAFVKGEWSPTLLISVNRYAAPLDHGPAAVIVSKHVRNEHSITARWKTLNYLDNIMAKEEATVAGADDAIMLNSARRVACASSSNIFLVRGETLKTPPLEEGAMPGVVRGVVLEEAQKAGIETELAPVDSKELFASALFLTNSLIGLRPAAKAGGRAPGGADMAKIAELKSRYEAAMKADLDAFGAAR